MNDFTYSYPVKVYFGTDAAKKAVSQELGKYGKTVMVAYGGGSVKKSGVYDAVVSMLKEAGKEIVDFSGIMPNPTYAKVQEGAALAKEKQVDFILAVGGGSVIDCCKIISAQAKTEKDIWEMEFTDHVFPTEFVPMGAIVTATGTGAEMNNGAVITHEEKKIKTGRDYPKCNPKFAIMDPEYTFSVPKLQTASGGFDILSHIMETYFSKTDDDNVSDDISEALMKSIIKNLPAALENPKYYIARSNLMWAATMAENRIIKLGKQCDFQAHQIEHQLGAYTNCNHGCGLAVIHPTYYRKIYKNGMSKFVKFAKNVWGISDIGKTADKVALEGIDALADFIKKIGLPTTLRELGIDDKDILPDIAASCNIAPGSYGDMNKKAIMEILVECY